MTEAAVPPRVAVIAAQWHSEIVNSATASFARHIGDSMPVTVEHFNVPGAFEIPLHARRLARTGDYAAIVACALIVDGGIYRHEFVAGTVVDALMRVQLETDVPIFSGVLTPHQFHQHQEHVEFFRHHFEIKGHELANTVAETLRSLEALPHR